VDAEGVIDLARLEEAMGTEGSGTALVCVMHANNEIGTIEPVEAVGRLARARGAHFHVDAVQTAGHVPVDVKAIGCDTLAISAHKLGGPKGMGALYVRKGVELGRLIHGGGQERGRRAGTQNVAGIVGLGQAAELAAGRMKTDASPLVGLRDRLIAGIKTRVPGAKLNGPRARRLPGNVNFAFEGIESGELLMRLDMGGICASAGSACTSGALEPSHVLLAIGLAPELAHGSLRLTLGRENTESEVDQTIDLVAETVERMRE
jgi:cysteine desulfurase